jgi:hypothetical protein
LLAAPQLDLLGLLSAELLHRDFFASALRVRIGLHFGFERCHPLSHRAIVVGHASTMA